MTASQERYKILVVDADARFRKYLENYLKKYDYAVVQATDCERALELTNEQLPDIILCDTFPPLMQGIEFCWLVRETARASTVPIILMTAADDLEMRLNGYRNGADAFVMKPVSMRALITRVETLLQRVRQLAQPTVVDEDTVGGSLNVFRLPEILQLLNSTRQEGWLHLHTQGQRGVVGLVQGEVAFAKSPDREGEEAVLQMSAWTNGQFVFHREVIAPESNVQKNTMQLILECCAALDFQLNLAAKPGL